MIDGIRNRNQSGSPAKNIEMKKKATEINRISLLANILPMPSRTVAII